MDLSSGKNLRLNEQIEIASLMHLLVLDRLFLETNWLASDAVFHGGTALSIVRNSRRFSEDLDFMVTPEAIQKLDNAIEKVRDYVEGRMELPLPGGRVSVKGPRGNEVTKWEFKWDHPGRRGKVMVKAEFLVTEAALLSAYRSTHIIPTSRGVVGISTPLPVPDLISAWADKIKAMATRPDFKWRDAYDLAWIAQCLRREDEISVEDYRQALTATAAIYDKSLRDVEEGLSKVLASGVFESISKFETDMAKWFEEELYPRYRETGQFRMALAGARREVENAIEMINAPALGVSP